MEISADVSESPNDQRAMGKTAATGREEVKGEEGAEILRLDAHDDDVPDLECDSETPQRGPPKTPKRNKASSPQLEDVRMLIACIGACCVTPELPLVLKSHRSWSIVV